ncbi:MAG: hypothetical protein H6684_10830 [Deltaproteobacteria bacterium]|nr:hypothetical protein [Deltaproteobacteria bacterium]
MSPADDNDDRPLPTPRLAVALLAALAVAVTVGNLWWHSTHPAPVFDIHQLPLIAVDQVDRFIDHPIMEAAAVLWHMPRPHECLYNLTAAPFLLLSRTHPGLAITSTFFYLVAMLLVFAIAKRVTGDPWAGLIGATAFALTPAAFGWSRIFLPFTTSMAFSAAGVWLLTHAQGFTRAGPTLALAVLALFASVLGEAVGDNAPLLVIYAATGAYVFALRLREPGPGRTRALLLVGMAAMIVIAFGNKPYLRFALEYVGEQGDEYAATGGNVLQNPMAIFAYARVLATHILQPFFALLTVGAVALLITKRTWRGTPPAVARRRDEILILVWLLAPLLVQSLIVKKHYKYVLALVPACAALIGVASARLPVMGRRALAAAVLVVGGGMYVALSLGAIPALDGGLRPGGAFKHGMQPVHLPPAPDDPMGRWVRRVVEESADEAHPAGVFVASAGFHRDAYVLSYLFKLADPDRRVPVYNPIVELGHEAARRPLMPPPIPLRPTWIIDLFGRPDPRANPQFADIESVKHALMEDPAVRQGQTVPIELLDGIALQLLAAYQSIDWDNYEQRMPIGAARVYRRAE